jgi:hypothetical protein
MKPTVRLSALLLCFCILASLSLSLFSCSSVSASENRVTAVTLENGEIRVKAALTEGFLDSYDEKKVYLFELPSYYSGDADLSELDPVADTKPRAAIQFTLSAMDGVRSRLFSSYLVASFDPATERFTPLTAPMSLANPEAMAAYTSPAAVGETSVKGLISDYPSDAIRLGITHTVVDVFMEDLILPSWEKGAVSYVYNGVTRYLSAETLDKLDESVEVYTAAGVEVYLRFRLGSPEGKDVPVGLYLSPTRTAQDNAVNMTTDFSSSIMEGFFDFIANRYAAPADGSNPVEAFILGYRVNNATDYNHAEGLDLAAYVTNYEKLTRVAHTAIKSHNPNGRVYVSLDSRRTVTDGKGWDVSTFLAAFRDETAMRGDYGWHAACELYADTPSVWEENYTADAGYYTVRNLNTLTDLLDGEKYRDPAGSPRRLLISGFSIPAALKGGTSSAENDNRQAASYAYAYLTCVQNGRVEALIYSEHTDSYADAKAGDLRGLWTASLNASDGGSQVTLLPAAARPIFDVFKKIDTTAASELSVGLNAVIGASYTKLESAMAGKSSPVTAVKGSGFLTGYAPNHKKASPLYTFDNGHFCGFESAGNLTYMELFAAETLSTKALHARFERTAVCEPMGLTVTLSATDLIGAKEMILDLYGGQTGSSGSVVRPTLTLRLTRSAKGAVADGDGEIRYEATVSEVKSGAWQSAVFDVTPFTTLLDASDEVTITLLMDYPTETAPEGITSHDLGLAGIHITGHTAATQTPAGLVVGIVIALILLVAAVFVFLFMRYKKKR